MDLEIEVEELLDFVKEQLQLPDEKDGSNN